MAVCVSDEELITKVFLDHVKICYFYLLRINNSFKARIVECTKLSFDSFTFSTICHIQMHYHNAQKGNGFQQLIPVFLFLQKTFSIWLIILKCITFFFSNLRSLKGNDIRMQIRDKCILFFIHVLLYIFN